MSSRQIDPDDPRYDLEGEPLPPDHPLKWDRRPPSPRDWKLRLAWALLLVSLGLAIFVIAAIAGPSLRVID